MLVTDLIRRKRDGAELLRNEIEFLVNGYTRDQIPDYQMSSWLMAVLLRGMSRAELAALSETMLNSGQVLDFSELGAAKADKHSTGGVGDKTSLIIAPIVAAGGLYVPMISGRGLGHTGGTLDKLESIPGFNVNLSIDDFRRVLAQCGAGLIGQTAEIAPADKKLYALRDVTGTVESPYLICASIMSKKLAEGIDALVLDVKTGSGAFMKSEKDAAFLAELMVETGQRLGKRVSALITDMDQPLGHAVGNALEVVECINVLNGQGPNDLRELSLILSAWMFLLGKRVGSVDEGRELAEQMISTGKARDKFREMISLQGGNTAVMDDPGLLPQARHQADVKSPASGFVTAIMCEQIGTAGVLLGGGRARKEDSVDPAVGMMVHKKLGDRVTAGEALCTVHYNSAERLASAAPLIEKSYTIEAAGLRAKRPLVHRIIGDK
ncbi:MAG TPA: thymidine phosphorylase [Candidatus Angelobacter sp.]|jgi:pyrimidine-nucleoside phosphorylase/thymidine phosphorylase|nr:thymidine phosphorylase [Candidatus Angelobacter sp.]